MERTIHLRSSTLLLWVRQDIWISQAHNLRPPKSKPTDRRQRRVCLVCSPRLFRRLEEAYQADHPSAIIQHPGPARVAGANQRPRRPPCRCASKKRVFGRGSQWAGAKNGCPYQQILPHYQTAGWGRGGDAFQPALNGRPPVPRKLTFLFLFLSC